MHVRSRRKSLFVLPIVGILLLLPSVAAEEDKRSQAISLYDQARYAEARVLMEQIDAAGQADGSLLYRLYYCRRLANDPQAGAVLQRARKVLEQEAPTAETLEAPFYLANAYRNAGKLSEMQRIAGAATGRVEDGTLAEPSTALDRFRLGKLYADQERRDEAVKWYAQAVDGFLKQESPGHDAYLQWAGRYLADRAMEREDFSDAERYLEIVLQGQAETSAVDLDRLAVLQVRAGSYAKANETWRRVERLNPADANRARYCQNLTMMAAKLEALPEKAADGRAWSALTQEELEQTLLDQAEAVRSAISEAQEAGPLKPKERKKLQERIDNARPLFLAAGLEYAARGHGIREHAFFGGYAPLIFRERDWQLPSGE